MSLLVAIAFCSKDADRALDLLEWCGQLGRQNHPCLLCMDPDVDWETGTKAIDLASKSFTTVRCAVLPNHVDGWIPGSNALWKLAAAEARAANSAFLFVEPDAVPLKPDWVDRIESAYRRCGKSFLGPLVSHQQPGLPSPYLEGVAVYPADALDRIGGLICDKQSWTLSTAGAVVPQAENSVLFKHVWGTKGNSPSFSDTNIPGTHIFSLRHIPDDAVLYHRCKNGTLINLLRRKLGLWNARPIGIVPSVLRGSMKVVSLRRAGDIVALIPALWHLHHKGRMIQLVVHSDFMPLMQGVSYISPIEWKGAWEDPLRAAREHRAINAQVFGRGVPLPRRQANFVTEAWEKIKVPWNRYLPLEFDCRDDDREGLLCESVFQTDKPRILVKLHGHSSPFPHREFVWGKLREQFGESAELVDLDAVRAERIYDLLGLMDHADCLISTDTVTLHLNRGHPIPTVSFINGSIWGSSPRVGNIVCRVPYSEVPSKWDRISYMIKCSIARLPLNGIVLAYSDWKPKDAGTIRRHASCFSTWPMLKARMLPYKEGRNSTAIGDPYAMPFLRDMVDRAAGTGDEQIIAIANNDVSFDERLKDAVYDSCSRYGCYWSRRVDRPGGSTDNGVDFVAFTRQWWWLHEDLLPDFILGSIWWDDIIVRIMEWSGCREQPRLYYHEPHPHAMDVRGQSPHMRYADRLALEWIRVHGEPREKPVDFLRSL